MSSKSRSLVDRYNVGYGERISVDISISKSYSGVDISIPVTIMRGLEDGPTVAVTAAIHGDELNGTGVIRELLIDQPFQLMSGTLILVPVVNILGFEMHSRYMPDRRDLNRCFPGSMKGSWSSQTARSFFDQIIPGCDYCIDLHTASLRRTNFPNVRADMANEQLAEFAKAFGSELIIDGKGPPGSFRNAACNAGCATLILEAGEVWKVESTVVEYAIRGIQNCLVYLGMIEGEMTKPKYRIVTDSTKWIRSRNGGFLCFHVKPGDIVNKKDPIATNSGLAGDRPKLLRAPRDGIVLGMTTMPAVAPGSPVCHLAFPRTGNLKKIELAIEEIAEDSLYGRVRGDLSSSLMIKEYDS